MGHLIDLPKSRLGVDVEGGFEPEYRTVRGKAKLLKSIQGAAKRSRLVLLASDNDREGEAIAWHIRRAILDKAPALPVQRISFNEITPAAIKEAVKNPRAMDEGRVLAQQARRVLDRLVGYSLSPLLWKKVKNNLSAGRVQSVALRLVCDREAEVEAFVPEEYWSIEADFSKGRKAFRGELVALATPSGGPAGIPAEADERPRPRREGEAREIVSAIAPFPFVVTEVWESEMVVRPEAPLTTSRLIQAAADSLGFTGRKTMQIAQQLYEGVKVGRIRVGLITYMRTDSVRVSQASLDEARAFIASEYPAELPGSPRPYRTAAGAQGAHEAVRPTLVARTPESVSAFLTRDQERLYALVWEIFVASQMIPAKLRTRTAYVQAGPAIFSVSSTLAVEGGFRKVLKVSASRADREGRRIPELKVGETLRLQALRPEQRFTQGPARFTESSFIRALDEEGLGRPSTYVSIVEVLLERGYVTRDRGELLPSVLGRLVSEVLVESFPDLIEAGFTSAMESSLDEVGEDGSDWALMIRDFYGPFKARVDRAMEGLESSKGSLDEATDLLCENCGRPMVRKLGRFGFFLACSGFPACKTTRSIPLGKCPACGQGDIVARRRASGRGREFYGCTRYPDCAFVSFDKPSATLCPGCGHFLVEKFDKKHGSRKACINPDCGWLHVREEGSSHG
jgi:DNA topoisomerase-1